MKKFFKISLFFLIIFSFLVYSRLEAPDANQPPDNTATGDGGGTTTDPTPNIPTNSHTYVAGNGAKVVNEVGFSESGNTASVGSADSIYTSNFVFNDVINTVFTVSDHILTSATVTSGKDDNIVVINNPFDPIGSEKIKIYLNNSQTMTYSYDTENVTIGIPATSKMMVTKGTKNITIEPNGANTKIIIDNSKITKDGQTYDKPQYTIFNANLTYQNKNIIERLITAGNASVRIDTEKGFGYLLLNGQTQILPGDSYEYYNLTKKEFSYSLYNQGQSTYEYGFLKGGFIYELLSVIAPTAINYGFEGSSEITLKGIIEYKRMQSYDQLKAIAGTYNNYKAMQLPFLTVYKSEKPSNEYKIRFQSTNYTANHKYEDNTVTVSDQNTGHHKITIEKHSPVQYYYMYNLQDCPNYLIKSSATPSNDKIGGDIKIEKGTLTYRNWKVYTEGTDDYTKINDKLKQMIITSSPEKYGSVDLG